jgi:hypothetical protein
VITNHKKNILPDLLNLTVHKTIHSYKGGTKALAKKIGVNAGTLNNKADPAMVDHTLNLYDLMAILSETKDPKILFEIAKLNGYVCLPIQDFTGTSDMEILEAWANWSAERGETEQAIRKALLDNKVLQPELDKIKSEMYEDFQTELELLKRLEAIKDD